MALVQKGNKPECGLPDGTFQAQDKWTLHLFTPWRKKILGSFLIVLGVGVVKE
jgi:hypothetical protein